MGSPVPCCQLPRRRASRAAPRCRTPRRHNMSVPDASTSLRTVSMKPALAVGSRAVLLCAAESAAVESFSPAALCWICGGAGHDAKQCKVLQTVMADYHSKHLHGKSPLHFGGSSSKAKNGNQHGKRFKKTHSA